MFDIFGSNTLSYIRVAILIRPHADRPVLPIRIPTPSQTHLNDTISPSYAALFHQFCPCSDLHFIGLVTWSLVHRFDTLTLVPDIKSSVLIAHADDDADIPSTHGSTLFDAFLEPHLPAHPSLPANPLSHGTWGNYTSQETLRINTRKEVVQTTVVDGFGVYEEMTQAVVDTEGGRKVALLRTERGGHDIGRVEGVQDAIGRMFGLY